MNWKMNEEGALLGSFEQFNSMKAVLNRVTSSLALPGIFFLAFSVYFFAGSELEGLLW